MLGGIKAAQVYIVCGYTDLRHSINGLAAIVKQNYGMNPYNRSLFLLCDRRRDRIKELLWDEDGFLLLYKRLNDGGFQWPRPEFEMKLLNREQFVWLMQGLSVEQPKAIRKRTSINLL